MGIILFSAKHEQLPLSMFLTLSYLQIFHTYAALTASPLVYMNNHNLIISKLCLTGSNKWSGMPWLFSLQGPIFRVLKKLHQPVRSPNKTSENNTGIKMSQLLAICYQWGKCALFLSHCVMGAPFSFHFVLFRNAASTKLTVFSQAFFQQ